MVLGLRLRRRTTSVRVIYVIYIKEIKPWSLSSSNNCKPVCIQWQSDGRHSGGSRTHLPELGPNVLDGKITFNESFQLCVVLFRGSSNRSVSSLTEIVKFRKKLLEFDLYETKGDHVIKGRHIGRAFMDLADYGIPEKTMSVTIPIHLSKGVKGALQPSLALTLRTLEGDTTNGGNDPLFSVASSDKHSKDTFSIPSSDKDSSGIRTASKLSDEDVEDFDIASFIDDESSACLPVLTSATEIKENSVCSAVASTVELYEVKYEDYPGRNGSEKTTESVLGPSANGVPSSEGRSPSVVLTESPLSESPDFQTCSIASSTTPQLREVDCKSPAVNADKIVNKECHTLEEDSFNNGRVSSDREPRAESAEEAVIESDIRVDSFCTPSFQNIDNTERSNRKSGLQFKTERTSSIIHIQTEKCNYDYTITDFQRQSADNKVVYSRTGRKVSFKEAIETVEENRGSRKVKAPGAKPEEVEERLPSCKEEEEKNASLTAEPCPTVDFRLDVMEKAGVTKQNSKYNREPQKRSTKTSDARNMGKNSPGSKTKIQQDNKPKKPKVRSKSISETAITPATEFDDKLVEEVKEISISEPQLTSIGDKGNADALMPHTVENRCILTPENNVAGTAVVSRNGLPKEENKLEEKMSKDENKKLIFAEARAAVSDDKVKKLETEVERLKDELREAALLEAAVYSVVAEHGGSFQKVHAPARRLARFHIHASKNWSENRRVHAANNTVAGLILAAKACGNDVPRLTFWWSNTIVLREIIAQTFECYQPSMQALQNGDSHGFRRVQRVPSSPKRTNDNNEGNKCPNGKEGIGDWQEMHVFIDTLEKIESWIHGRVVESIWWQNLTPYMQCVKEDAIKHSSGTFARKGEGKVNERMDVLDLAADHELENFALELWNKAFSDAFQRLCPLRAEGHECGCLPTLSKMVLEQCIARLDVAMLNAILREREDDMPTDPLSDPISDTKVLPIPACNLSFGSGAKLKNAVGNWSRCLTDLINDDSEGSRGASGGGENASGNKAKSSFFTLLNEVSDLLMLPKDMLIDKTIKKEVCPNLSTLLIKRILSNFITDEFCPHPVPFSVLQALNSEARMERHLEGEKDVMHSAVLPAPSVQYQRPPLSYLKGKIGDVNTKDMNSDKKIRRSVSGFLMKGYTSDDELVVLESPLALLSETASGDVDRKAGNHYNGKLTKDKKEPVSQAGTNRRYQLLREAWS